MKNDIAAAPFLEGMSHRHVEILASCGRRTHFNEGKIIPREGDTANRFSLIEEGAVDLGAGFLPIDGEPPISAGLASAKWKD